MGWEKPTDADRRSAAAGAGAAATAALAVVVIAGVVLGAVLLRPDGHLFVRGHGLLGGNVAIAVGLAALALVGGLLLHGRLQELSSDGRELSPVEQRLADATGYVTMFAPFAVSLLLLAMHAFHTSGGSDHGSNTPTPIATGTAVATQTATMTPPPHLRHTHHYGLVRILTGIAIALAAALVVVAGVFLWRQVRRMAPHEAQEPYDAVDDDERELLAQAVDSGRRALLAGDDPRAAVIACYAAMEESLAASGVVRRASDSPQDLLERAVAKGLPAGDAAADLTALFREARYSRHPMDAGHRERAQAALTAIADRLEALAPATEGTS
ncbi:DUF4129 domain-containing protein [Streptomyces sp. V4-01]|uniref:DUF4129 domain-containing protein n=1 Tax=Actinacidiphila polyblastidii TaxID=3110430 RepID=A0ABU7PD90_9ACTN|nr:DUF4129 domain-containing protein [Streptomyces sp. V4-01]